MSVPSALAPRQLPALLSPRLVGTPADGSAPLDGAPRPDAVVWVDRGDEVIVHLDSLQVDVTGDVVLVGLDLETDQAGRATLVVPFAVGTASDGGVALVAEGSARGPAELVTRWGEAVQEAAYAALIDLSETHAAERGGRPRAIYVKDGKLQFAAAGTA